MSKIKRFLKMHYKKFVTFITLTFLLLSILVSQALAVTYQYIMLDDYRSSVYDYYYNLYQEDNTALTLDWIIPSRDPSNNRFTATVITGQGALDKYVHRFDLTVRFNTDFEFLAGDTVSFYFWLSSYCHLQYWDDTKGYLDCTYYLQFFRVWFADDSTFVFYPEHHYMTSNQVNELPMTIEMGTLSTAKPRIVSMQFSFNVVKGATLGLVGIRDEPYLNLWFGNSIRTTVIRDTSQTPIYTSPNNDSIDNHNKIEQGIQEDISGGLDDTSVIFDNFNGGFTDQSRLTRGMLFITQLMSRVFAFEAYDILGDFALAIGLVGFLLGLASLLKGSKQKDDKPDKPHTKENSDSYNEYSRRRK